MRHPDDYDLDALLCGAATVQRDPAEEERLFADAWSRVQKAIGAEHAGPVDELQQRRVGLIADRDLAARRRRRAARVASVTLAVVVAGAGTAAAAEFIATRTGSELPAAEVGSGGSGEVLDLGGTDAGQVSDEVTADILFAPGYEAQRSWALHYLAPDPGSATTESHLRSWIASNAVCTWADVWVTADNAGNTDARTAAATTLSDSLTWEPVLTFARDHGEPDPADAAGGASYYGWLRPLAAAAGAGDRQGVLDAVADGHVCSPEVLPVIAADPNYGGAR